MSNGCSETCDATSTARTRGFRWIPRKTFVTARTLTGFVEPTFTRTGRRSLPRRSISFARILREAIGTSSSARTMGTTWIARGGNPRRARSSFRFLATPSRSSLTTMALKRSFTAGPYGSSSGPIVAPEYPRFLNHASNSRFRVAYGFTLSRPFSAMASVVRPMNTSPPRANAASRRASWPGWRMSNVPPIATRMAAGNGTRGVRHLRRLAFPPKNACGQARGPQSWAAPRTRNPQAGFAIDWFMDYGIIIYEMRDGPQRPREGHAKPGPRREH